MSNGVSDLLSAPDGSLRASVSYDNYEGKHRRPIVQRITADGVQLAPLRLFPKSTKSVSYMSPRSALIPGGAVVAVGRYQRGDKIVPDDPAREDAMPPAVRVRTLALDGAVLADDPLTMVGGDEAMPEDMVAGPSGAAALTLLGLRTPADDSHLQWLAFKPAGSLHFGPAIRVSDFAPDDEGQVHLSLSPDGGGAVVVAPSGYTSPSKQPIVRRISPTGELGPPFPLEIPSGLLIDVDATFGPSGTLLVAISTSRASSSPRDEGSAPAGLYASTLGLGDAAPSVPVKVPGSVDSGGGDWPALAMGPGDQAAIVTPRRPSGLRVFTGVGTQLRQTATFASSRWSDVFSTFLPNGRVAVLWSVQEGGTETRQVWGASADAGGAFGRPRALTRAHKGGVRLDHIAPMPDGRVAVVYDVARSRSYVSVVRP